MNRLPSVLRFSPADPILARPPGMLVFGAVMVVIAFAATLAMGAILAERRDTALWDDRAFGRLTVQIMPDGTAPPPAEIAAALALLRVTPGIASADVMSASENAALIAPWIRPGETTDSLPFPALIDVKMDRGATLDVTGLKQRLLASAPHAVVDDRRQSFVRGDPVTAQPLWMAVIVLGVCAVSFVLAVTGVLRGWITAQQPDVELLRLLGISDRRVASLIGRTWMARLLVPSIAGSALACSLLLPWAISGNTAIHLPVPVPGVSPFDLLWLAFIPVSAAIIAWVTCRLLVRAALRRT